MGRKKIGADEEEVDSGGWMVTFSDLSTLLLTFFVLLLSMSSMDDRTLKSMFTNFTSACGILYFKELGEVYKPKEVLIDGLYERLKNSVVVKSVDDPATKFTTDTEEKVFEEVGGLTIEEMNRGFKLVFGHKLLFEPGEAVIKEDMKPVLEKVGTFMKNSAYQVYIDGHTDNIPINTKEFPSNLDLSLARSYNLLNYLVEVEQVPSIAMSIAGYGALRPVVSNDTPIGRAQNRRVEIIFKNRKYF